MAERFKRIVGMTGAYDKAYEQGFYLMVAAKKLFLELIDLPTTLRELKKDGFQKGSWQFRKGGVELRAWKIKNKRRKT